MAAEPMDFAASLRRARHDWDVIADICRKEQGDHRTGAEKALIDAQVKVVHYKEELVAVGMKPHAASIVLAVTMIVLMKYTGDVPVMVTAVLAMLLVLCLKILQHLDLLHAGMQSMHENKHLALQQ